MNRCKQDNRKYKIKKMFSVCNSLWEIAPDFNYLSIILYKNNMFMRHEYITNYKSRNRSSYFFLKNSNSKIIDYDNTG